MPTNDERIAALKAGCEKLGWSYSETSSPDGEEHFINIRGIDHWHQWHVDCFDFAESLIALHDPDAPRVKIVQTEYDDGLITCDGCEMGNACKWKVAPLQAAPGPDCPYIPDDLDEYEYIIVRRKKVV